MIAQKLWDDDAGFVISIELILISTIVVIGLIAGLTAVRDAVVSELSDVAGAINEMNQSFSFNGATGATSATAGSSFLDQTDSADTPEDTAGTPDNCIVFTAAPRDEGT